MTGGPRKGTARSHWHSSVQRHGRGSCQGSWFSMVKRCEPQGFMGLGTKQDTIAPYRLRYSKTSRIPTAILKLLQAQNTVKYNTTCETKHCGVTIVLTKRKHTGREGLLIGINMIMVLLYSMVISCISRKSIYDVTQFFVFPNPRIRKPNVRS